MNDLSKLTSEELSAHIESLRDNPSVSELADCVYELSRRIQTLEWTSVHKTTYVMESSTTTPEQIGKVLRDLL